MRGSKKDRIVVRIVALQNDCKRVAKSMNTNASSMLETYNISDSFFCNAWYEYMRKFSAPRETLFGMCDRGIFYAVCNVFDLNCDDYEDHPASSDEIAAVKKEDWQTKDVSSQMANAVVNVPINALQETINKALYDGVRQASYDMIMRSMDNINEMARKANEDAE